MKNWETKKVAEEHIYKYEVQTELYPVPDQKACQNMPL